MEANSALRSHRLVFSVTSGTIGACALASTFFHDAYGHPALVVLASTALCMWSALISIYSQFSQLTTVRMITIILASLTISTMIVASEASNQSLITAFAFSSAGIAIACASIQNSEKFALWSLAVIGISILVALIISRAVIVQPVVAALCLTLLAIEFCLIRYSYMPVVSSLNEALARAEIFSTITKSSREFHSREPEEAIRNIVNVTKALGYISVSVVSFDRRQRIFEDGVPIPNAMEVAVRASATRRVAITTDESETKNTRSRQGDVIGVPIWINGRYSAALVVQTSSLVKVTQRDCEALELLADQAGRALENAGKAAMDRRVVERLTDESQRDKLTGLGNRRFADSMVATMKPGDVLAMVDLDGLKGTNDIYGHAAGDALLHEVGLFLAEQIRNPDMAARLGGDEFMILLRNAESRAATALERLVILWRNKKLYDTTFSIGMAEHHPSRTTHETVEAADDALYQAKKAGKDRLVASTTV